MNNIKKQSLKRLKRLFAASTCSLTIAILLGQDAKAQLPRSYTTTHDFGVDMKNYSGHVVTDQSLVYEDAMYMGTVFNYPTAGRNVPHFVSVSLWGGILTNQVYDLTEEYKDIRSVAITGQVPEPNAIVPSGSLTYYSVCLARPDNDPRINTSKGVNDRILVIPVQNNGTIKSGQMAYSIKSPNENEGLYPVSAYYDQSSGALYICGYITDDMTSLPAEPAFTTNGNHRKAFVLRVDNPGSTNPTVSNSITIDTHYPFHPNLAFNEDYDIAMRITKTCNGNIHITGSVNNVKTNGASVPPLTDPTYSQYSATMNIVLAPDLKATSAEGGHFGVEYNPNTLIASSAHEYGIAFMQENDLDPSTWNCTANHNNYIMSNYFIHNSGISPWGPFMSMDLQPTYMSFTHVDGNSSTTPYAHNVGVNSRLRLGSLNAQWGLQHVNNYPKYAMGADFAIAGMTTDEYCGATGASVNNVLPFLMNFNLGYASSVGIFGWFNKRVSFQNASTTGTGTYPLMPNSYPKLGGGLSNWAWCQTPAAWTFFGLYSLSAPRYTASNQLGLKTVKLSTWASPEPVCGPNSYKEYAPTAACPDNRSYEEVRGLGIPGLTPTGLPAMVPNVNPKFGELDVLPTLVITPESVSISDISYTSVTCSSGGPNYKTGESTSTPQLQILSETNQTVVYPNPATDYVKVTPAKDIAADASITVKLYNMMGAHIATLYSGKAGELADTKLTLPQVAAGLYMIRVNNAERMITNQKIQIK